MSRVQDELPVALPAAGELFKQWSFPGEGHLGSSQGSKRANCVDLRAFTEMLKALRLKIDRRTVQQIFQQAQKQAVRRPDEPRPDGDPTEMYWVEFELALRKVCEHLKLDVAEPSADGGRARDAAQTEPAPSKHTGGAAPPQNHTPGHGIPSSNKPRSAAPAEPPSPMPQPSSARQPGRRTAPQQHAAMHKAGKRRLKPIAHAVRALLGLNRHVYLRAQEAATHIRSQVRNRMRCCAHACCAVALVRLRHASPHCLARLRTHARRQLQKYQTCGGKFRLRDLPLCPLTNFADEVAREEVCEIVPGVFQSNWKGAESWRSLEALGITHVVSTLEADGNPFPRDISYLNLVFEDEEDVDPSPHFDAACGFMRLALTSKGGAGKCLVHCAAGVSRSSAITIAFLVREQHFSLREAFVLLRERRPICWPNTGFMRRLIGYEALHGGCTSLDIGEYEQWTERNYEAVKLAKVVDRVSSADLRVGQEVEPTM